MGDVLRVISYCHQGVDKDQTSNTERLENLNTLVDTLTEKRIKDVDAIVLPGGYLYLDNLDIDRKSLNKSTIVKDLHSILSPLHKTSPNANLIIGIDTKPKEKHQRIIGGQQIALALDFNNVTGVGRKICPVQEDFDGLKYPVMLVHEKDFYDDRRYAKLSPNKLALLCACYDMFGFVDAKRANIQRMRNIILLEDINGNLHEGRDAFVYFKEVIQPQFDKLFKENEQNIVLATANIHRFERTPKESFWHRHGIASASAAFNGCMSIAAAHFEQLPKDRDKGTLCAVNVATSHLEQAGHRKLHSHKPEHAFYIKSQKGAKTAGLARVFTV
ncbi:MAG: hypothetical protein NZ828_03265 [Alphaproteobacteria bacterium]|nr:hypothetical protein [Alphaproteobacteria bacterium]